MQEFISLAVVLYSFAAVDVRIALPPAQPCLCLSPAVLFAGVDST